VRRLVCVLALCVLTTACARLHQAEYAPDATEALFDAGLAQLAAGRQPAAFATLAKEYPVNSWTNRSRSVQTLIANAAAALVERDHCTQRLGDAETSQEELRHQVEALTAGKAVLQDERDRLTGENTACTARLDQLRAANAGLLQDLEQLKNLTIEMELRR